MPDSVEVPAQRPLCFDNVSAAGQLELLGLAFGRIAYSAWILFLVGLPFPVWYWQLGQDFRSLAAWVLGFAVFSPIVSAHYRAFRKDAQSAADGGVVQRWLPRLHGLALVYGFMLAIPLLLVSGEAPFEFVVLYVATIAAIVALNATHQSRVMSVFLRYFAASWGTCVLLVPLAFPSHWLVVLPLTLLYAHSILRHSRVSHQFYLQHIVLEEEAARLAAANLRAKEEAEAALRAKSLFLTTASHDLRQPVHAMGFLIESIVHRNRDPALLAPLADLRRSVRSVTLMFNSLLDLSRIESGSVDVRCLPVDVHALFQEVEALFREEANSRGLALRVHVPRGAPIVLADPLLLRQSLVNLVHNALRYTLRGGLLLGARQRRDGWQLEVWDTGMGVANADRGHLYSPFFRNQHAWRIDSAGHGLGLAVVARCAELMGARYGFDSVEGRGSRFWIRLQKAAALDAPLPAEFGEPTASYRPLTGTCLVVDDDPQVASAWRSLMHAWGVEVRCAGDATEAMSFLDAGFRPQAILCDQRLRSGESGFDVLKALFARCPEAGGAMVSGEFASPELREAEQEGYLILRKPVAVAQLHGLLEQWLD